MMKNDEKYDVAVASGIFDIFHIGHLQFLIECKKLCKTLVVVISSDELTYKIKNKRNIFNQNQRKMVLEELRIVDAVEIRNKEIELVDICKKHNAQIVFKGADYDNKCKKWEPDTVKALMENQIDLQIVDHKDLNIHSSNLRNVIQ